jgi:integrase
LFFATKKAAELELERIRFKLRREGSRALQLSDSLRIMAMDCADKLAPFGKTLEDATNHYLAILTAAANSITLGSLITEYIASRERSACSRVHLIDLKHRLGRLLADVGKDTPVRTITTQRLESWLHGLALAPQSVNNFRNKTFGLFGYAQKRGFVETNPVAAIDLIKIVDTPVEVYTADELQRLLEAAGPELQPCIAICAFAGTRTAELLKLSWGDIDLVRGRIKIAAHKSKTAQRRLISISEN